VQRKQNAQCEYAERHNEKKNESGIMGPHGTLEWAWYHGLQMM